VGVSVEDQRALVQGLGAVRYLSRSQCGDENN